MNDHLRDIAFRAGTSGRFHRRVEGLQGSRRYGQAWPSTVSPEGSVTVAVTVRRFPGVAARSRGRPRPRLSEACADREFHRPASPFKSPTVTEWQLLHLEAKKVWPSAALPTRMLGASLPSDGGVHPGRQSCRRYCEHKRGNGFRVFRADRNCGHSIVLAGCPE